MDVPLDQPPFNADDLDVVEIVLEVEERLGITLPDADLDRAAGVGDPTELKTRLIPRVLAELARRIKEREEGRR